MSKANLINLAKKAKVAAFKMALIPKEEKSAALLRMADALHEHKSFLIEENTKDVKAAKKVNYPAALIDRLILNDKRIEAMAQGLIDTAKLKDPVGEVLETIKRPNGLVINKVRVPIGVVGIIYESRPNVTSDCIGLCFKSGNSVILKGGKEAAYSNKAIFNVIKKVLVDLDLPSDAIQLVITSDRKELVDLLQLDQYIDVIVPRGGEGLIEFVANNSRIPVIKHYKGVCHTYVSASADLEMARKICINAKVQRPGVCNAMETMLVDKKVAEQFLPVISDEMIKAGVELRADPATRKIVKQKTKAATAKDWQTEYLDLILSIRVVDGVDQAIEHINTFGSHHSDTIVTTDPKEGEQFLRAVDSACVYINASTRFTDGYEFGMGAEVGISTDKIHARGPMALEGLTTYKFEVYGSGQIRG